MAETGKLKSFLFASCSAEGLTQPGFVFMDPRILREVAREQAGYKGTTGLCSWAI